MIKKITIGLATICSALSLNAFAGQMKSPVDVSVPVYNGGFTFGLAGLYLRPRTDSFDYAIISPEGSLLSPTIPGGTTRNVNPDYDWGYRLNVGYYFPCSGNDVYLSYTNFHRDEHDSVIPRANETLSAIGIDFIVPAEPGVFAASHAYSDVRYQVADLDFGQHINIGCYTHLRFVAGARYVYLKTDFNADYAVAAPVSFIDVVATDILEVNQKDKIKGIGPRFGVASRVSMGSGFGVFGEAASALIVSDYKTTFRVRDRVLIDGISFADINAQIGGPKETRVVPNLTGKLGIDYSYQFCNCSHTAVTLQAGYQVDHYFNVLNRYDEVTNERYVRDISFDGPFVAVQVKL